MVQTQTGPMGRETSPRPSGGISGESSVAGSVGRAIESKFNTQQITGAIRDLKERGRGYMTESERYIRSNPLPVVFSALGVGFVLGLLMRRSR